MRAELDRLAVDHPQRGAVAAVDARDRRADASRATGREPVTGACACSRTTTAGRSTSRSASGTRAHQRRDGLSPIPSLHSEPTWAGRGARSERAGGRGAVRAAVVTGWSLDAAKGLRVSPVTSRRIGAADRIRTGGVQFWRLEFRRGYGDP